MYVPCLRANLQGTPEGFTEQIRLCCVWKDKQEFSRKNPGGPVSVAAVGEGI